MFVLCQFTDMLQSKKAELLAIQTTDTKVSSPARFLPPRVHRNYEVTFGRWRRCVETGYPNFITPLDFYSNSVPSEDV